MSDAQGKNPTARPHCTRVLDSLDALHDRQQMRDWLLHEQLMTPALIASTFAKPLRKAELLLESGALPAVKKSSLKRWQDEFGRAGDFRVMAHYAEKLQLPGGLQQQFRQQADEHASRCVHKREAFATFLLALEGQVDRSWPDQGA